MAAITLASVIFACISTYHLHQMRDEKSKTTVVKKVYKAKKQKLKKHKSKPKHIKRQQHKDTLYVVIVKQ